jgi:hypothetical protein
MPTPLSRRAFVVQPCLTVAALGLLPGVGRAEMKEKDPRGWPGFPHQPPGVVKEFVGACHGNLDRVRELVTAHPELAKSAYDWGFGDWESALGAAAHTGRREIAELLLSHGARLDIFAAAMLGMLEALRALVAASPGVEATPGPHGIMLLAHARAGKHAPTIEYVESLPKATAPAPAALDEAAMAAYMGAYASDDGMKIEVTRTRFGMAVKSQAGIERTLVPDGEHQFYPVGAPHVRASFTVADGRATRLEIVEGEWFVSAVRA